MSEPVSTEELLATLRQAGAARVDAVGWHYIEVLAERSRSVSSPAQALLSHKLHRMLGEFDARMNAEPARSGDGARGSNVSPSPLALLLQEMSPQASTQPQGGVGSTKPWHGESPRVQQFRKQLRKISVQKQVSRAIAQAPQNAGPINSHMLVLRALGLMRDIAPDYLNRFMTHLDTLLCLEEAERLRLQARKSTSSSKSKSKP